MHHKKSFLTHNYPNERFPISVPIDAEFYADHFFVITENCRTLEDWTKQAQAEALYVSSSWPLDFTEILTSFPSPSTLLCNQRQMITSSSSVHMGVLRTTQSPLSAHPPDQLLEMGSSTIFRGRCVQRACIPPGKFGRLSVACCLPQSQPNVF